MVDDCGVGWRWQTSVMSTVGVETVAAFLRRKFTSRACRWKEEVSSQREEQKETGDEIKDVSSKVGLDPRHLYRRRKHFHPIMVTSNELRDNDNQ